MKDFGKGMMVALMVLYVLSPVDLCPGPIDDVIVILLGIMSHKRSRADALRDEGPHY